MMIPYITVKKTSTFTSMYIWKKKFFRPYVKDLTHLCTVKTMFPINPIKEIIYVSILMTLTGNGFLDAGKAFPYFAKQNCTFFSSENTWCGMPLQ